MPLDAHGLPSFPITAYAACNALGLDTAGVERRLFEGATGLEPARNLPFATFWGELPGTLPPVPRDLEGHDCRVARIAQHVVGGVRAAVERAVLRWGEDRVAIVMGTSTGGIRETELAFATLLRGVRPPEYSFERQHAVHSLVVVLAAILGTTGPAYVVSTACSSSAKAFGSAQRLLVSGSVDAVLVGGVDTLCQLTLRGFAGLKISSEGPCRPFDANRAGLCLGEGGACALVEREGAALAYLLGVGESSDAYHPTAPHPEGKGAILAMTSALAQARLDAASIDYVNAHGTGTRANDEGEALAIARAIGASARVSSTKGAMGHLLGAAGAAEVAVCLASVAGGIVPGTTGLQASDPALALAPLARTERARVRHALSNSFAFGGANASVIVGGERGASTASPVRREIHLVSLAFWAPGYPTFADRVANQRRDASAPAAEVLPMRVRGRASVLTKLFAEVVGQASAARTKRPVAIVYGSAYGEMETTVELLRSLAAGARTLSPRLFQSSVHNTAAGAISIATANHECSTTVAAGPLTFPMALLEGMSWLGAHGGDAIVCVAEEPVPTEVRESHAFPPLAAALLLTTEVSPPESMGRISWVREASVDSPDSPWSEYAGNPAAAALPLMKAAWERRSFAVRLDRGGSSRGAMLLTPNAEAS